MPVSGSSRTSSSGSTLRTFGPTATTVAHWPRLLTVAAVAGISSPPLDRRSPSSSGRRTSTRSDIIVTALAAARAGTGRIDRLATGQGYPRVQFADGRDRTGADRRG